MDAQFMGVRGGIFMHQLAVNFSLIFSVLDSDFQVLALLPTVDIDWKAQNFSAPLL